MKKLLLILILSLTAVQASASSTPHATLEAKKLLEQAIREDVVIGGAIKRASAMGESCEVKVTSLSHDTNAGETF